MSRGREARPSGAADRRRRIDRDVWAALDPRRWALWTVPGPLVALVLVVTTTALVLFAVLALRDGLQLAETWRFALLVLGGGLTIEVTRRLQEPSGVVARDLMAAWMIPVILLLPPVWALLAPIPLTVLTHVRVRRAVAYRRVYSVAAIGVAGALTSAGFEVVSRPYGLRDLLDPRVLMIGAGFAVVNHILNFLLVGLAVRLADPELRVRELVPDGDGVESDLVETSAGLLVTVVAAVHPALVVLALPVVLVLQRSLLFAQVQAQARVDGRTGLLNAKTWEREADGLLVQVQEGRPAAVLLLDIDHFKAVNDTHGHQTGDEVLKALADTLREELRDDDVAGRLGGEEFAVILPDTDMTSARATAERLRERIALMRFTADGRTFAVTVSIGVSVANRVGSSHVEVIAAADRCLYVAKRSGRDQVRWAAPVAPRAVG